MQTPAPPIEGLMTLPEEVLERVLLYLPPRDIAAVNQTCHKLADLAESSPSIQYNVALQEQGYVDSPVRREAILAAREREREEAERAAATGPSTPMSGIESDTVAALFAEASEGLAERMEEARRQNFLRGQDMSDEELMELMRAVRAKREAARQRQGGLAAASGSSRSPGPSLEPGSPLETVIKSPHTGKPRPTLASVALPPWPSKPPSTRKDYSFLSTAEKNKALRGRERRWDSINPAQIRRLSVRGPSGVYELQEGILLMCEERSALEKPTIIRLIPLPSIEDPDLEDPIIPTKSHTVPFPIADLTMDPTQDLIVVSEYEPTASRPTMDPPAHRYHLLTLSTFEPHPLAALPTLDFPPATVPSNWPRQLIQVMGDTLVAHISREGVHIVGVQGAHAVVMQDSEEEIVAWNWKTGEVLGRVHLGRTSAACTFCMLTPTLIAVARSTVIRQSWDLANPEGIPAEQAAPPAIVFISFAAKPGHPKVEQPLQTNRLDTTTPRAVEVARLLMPGLKGDVEELTLENFHMRPDPAYPVVPGTQATLGRGKPFTQDSARGLMVVELWITKDFENRTASYEMFMLRETLVRIATEHENRLRASWADDTAFETADIDWADWGEENTRLMPQVQTERRRWVCSCSGYRMASLVSYASSFGGEGWTQPEVEDPDEPLTEPAHRVHLVVHDFNPTTVAKTAAERKRRGGKSSWVVKATPDEDEDNDASAKSLGDDYTITLWDHPTSLLADDIWEHDVVTRLPFRTIRRGLVGFPNGVMIDDQRVLTVYTSKAAPHTLNQRQDITVLCM